MIVQNAGGEGSIVVEKVRASKDKNFGYNALTDTYEDLVQAGVIDPTKVTRTALQNAASIARSCSPRKCLIVEKKEDKPPPRPVAGRRHGRDVLNCLRLSTLNFFSVVRQELLGLLHAIDLLDDALDQARGNVVDPAVEHRAATAGPRVANHRRA
jgi:hypothetical protein